MKKIYISMYHYTRDLCHSRYPKIRGLDSSLFRHQIEFMKNNFNIITMEQVVEATEGRCELPEKAALLTFDDGYVDNYTFALPVLEEYGVQGSFFIPGKTFSTHTLLDVNKIHYILASADISQLMSDVKKEMDFYRGMEYDYASSEELYSEFAIEGRYDDKDTVFVKMMLQTVLPERLRGIISSKLFEKYVGISEEKMAYELYMTEEQIRLLKAHGMYIGLHGYDHYWLGHLSKEEMHRDIDLALDTLGEFIDRKQWVMNYPYGDYNQDVIDYVQSQGACLGLSTDVRIANLDIDNRYALPRLDCNDFPPKSTNYLNL